MSFPTHLPIGVYRITLQALDPIQLSGFSAATLRGAFGWSFKRMVCYQPQVKTCAGCLLRAQCAYPKVFEPMPPPGSAHSGQQNVPAPYVLRPPNSERTRFEPGETFSFEVILFGQAIGLLPYFAIALQQLEQQGVGKGRGRARIESIEAVSPAGGSADEIPTRLFDQGQPDVIHAHPGWAAEQWVNTNEPPEQVTVEFMALTRLKSGGKIQAVPDFEVLARALMRRASGLCRYHSEQPWEADFKALTAAAKEVETVAGGTRDASVRRYSSKQERRVDWWGVQGLMVYRGNLVPFWPLLQLGQLLHVGKGCTFGLGRYRLL